jgi:hypothetical protein
VDIVTAFHVHLHDYDVETMMTTTMMMMIAVANIDTIIVDVLLCIAHETYE